MGTEVSWVIKNDAKSGLITRDFLGGCSNVVESKELDLDLHVPFGWEKHLDLKSGQVYIERCNPASKTTSDQKTCTNQTSSKLPDSKSGPKPSSSLSPTRSPTLNLLKQPSLDLKLLSNPSHSTYTSVCTLDKVKSALDRAERSSPSSLSSSSSRKRFWASSSNSSSLSIKETEGEVEKGSSKSPPVSSSDQSGLLVAAACPVCLLYVLISENDPKCPKCNSVVRLPVMMTKKPKIDLNIAI